MPPPAGTLRVGRYFLALLVIVAVLYGIVFWPGQRHSPSSGSISKVAPRSSSRPGRTTARPRAKSSMQEARQIIEQRVNAYGVAESTVVIQGNDQIVISDPRQERERHLEHRRCGQTELPAGRHATGDAAQRRHIRLAHRQPIRGRDHAGADAKPRPRRKRVAARPSPDRRTRARPLAAPSTTPSTSATTSPAKSATPTPSASATTPAPTAKSANPLAGLNIRDSAERDRVQQAHRSPADSSCGRPCRTSTATPSRRTTTRHAQAAGV